MVVGVCTAGRLDGLWRLISALPSQSRWRRQPAPVLLVVDNTPSGDARATAEEACARYGIQLEYRHVVPAGLAVARNAALDAASGLGSWLAFVDDDEVPEPQWLDELFSCQEETGAPIVTGPVEPRFDDRTPDWLVEGRFLQIGPFPDRGLLREAISGNALISLTHIHEAGIRFDGRYDRTGGEDQLFFRQARAAGLEIRHASKAVIHEEVPASRHQFSYLLRRELQKGNVLGLIARDHPELGEGPMLRAAAAGKWMLDGVAGMVVGLARRSGVHSRRAVLRCVRAAGMIGGLLGWRFGAYRR